MSGTERRAFRAARRLRRARRTYLVRRILGRLGVYGTALIAATAGLAPLLARRQVLMQRSSGLMLLISAVVALVTVALALPAGYAVGRLERKGTALLLACLVPPVVLLFPLRRALAVVRLGGTPWAMILVGPMLALPLSVWLMAGFLRRLPPDVEEQALVDGHSRLGAFVRVVLPLALPGAGAVAVFAFAVTIGESFFVGALAAR